ncbi:thermophilic metalloprotease (M29) [Halolamina pelagica]|uniref:Thermophilic metalloprotease (M29) n=1 Tax=Halolamina pelagica TaxID=699431 RepID=A0A0P7GTG1_9EURY|nr:thermophilic metalloprotease (M29) [Halolamina pelagica]
MDDRIREHARTLVDWSARIEAGDDVVLSVSEGAHDLAVAVAEELGKRDANVVTLYDADEVDRAHTLAHSGEFDESPEFERALYEHADAMLRLGGGRNTTASADVPAGKRRRKSDHGRGSARRGWTPTGCRRSTRRARWLSRRV